MKFSLKAPCSKCPFLKGTAMKLRPGRMQELADQTASDFHVFPCHEHTDKGRDKWQACIGSLAYGMKEHRQLPVLARIALSDGFKLQTITTQFDKIEEPGKWELD